MGELRRTATELALAKEPVTVMLQTTCKEIRGSQIILERNGKELLEADFIVMAIGSKPRPSDHLKETCYVKKIPFYIIGDALATPPRLGIDAIHEAFEAAFNI